MKKTAYIIVHGFCGTPKDVMNIKKYLIKKGISSKEIFTPCLKGHGIKGKCKKGTTHQDIIEGLKEYINRKCKIYTKRILIGYSMGGLISLMVTKEAKISDLILLNAPMRVWTFRGFVWTILKRNFNQKIHHVRIILSTFTYSKIMTSIELRKLQRYVRENLKKVTANTYIVQSKKDYVARPSSAKEIFNNITSERKEIMWIDNATHFLPEESCIEEVIDKALEWVNESKKKESLVV